MLIVFDPAHTRTEMLFDTTVPFAHALLAIGKSDHDVRRNFCVSSCNAKQTTKFDIFLSNGPCYAEPQHRYTLMRWKRETSKCVVVYNSFSNKCPRPCAHSVLCIVPAHFDPIVWFQLLCHAAQCKMWPQFPEAAIRRGSNIVVPAILYNSLLAFLFSLKKEYWIHWGDMQLMRDEFQRLPDVHSDALHHC